MAETNAAGNVNFTMLFAPSETHVLLSFTAAIATDVEQRINGSNDHASIKH